MVAFSQWLPVRHGRKNPQHSQQHMHHNHHRRRLRMLSSTQARRGAAWTSVLATRIEQRLCPGSLVCRHRFAGLRICSTKEVPLLRNSASDCSCTWIGRIIVHRCRLCPGVVTSGPGVDWQRVGWQPAREWSPPRQWCTLSDAPATPSVSGLWWTHLVGLRRSLGGGLRASRHRESEIWSTCRPD